MEVFLMLLALCLLIFSGLVAYLCWFTYEMNLRIKFTEEALGSCIEALKEAQSKIELLGRESKKAPPKPKKASKKLEK